MGLPTGKTWPRGERETKTETERASERENMRI